MVDLIQFPGVTYESGWAGKIRNQPISEEALRMMMAAAYATDPRLQILVRSGGQHSDHDPSQKGKPGGWTGSTRHDVDQSGYSPTADVILTLNGKQLNPGSSKEIYGDFLSNAAAVGFKGLGHYTWGVHIGAGSPAAWGPDKTSKTLSPYFRDRIAEGRSQFSDGVGKTLLANYAQQVPTPKTGLTEPPAPAMQTAGLNAQRQNPVEAGRIKSAMLPYPAPPPVRGRTTALDAIMGTDNSQPATLSFASTSSFDPRIPVPAPLLPNRFPGYVKPPGSIPRGYETSQDVASLYEGILPTGPRRPPPRPDDVRLVNASLSQQPRTPPPVPTPKTVPFAFPSSFPRATDPAMVGARSGMSMTPILTAEGEPEGGLLPLDQRQTWANIGDIRKGLNDTGVGSVIARPQPPRPPAPPIRVLDQRSMDARIAEQRAEQNMLRNQRPPLPPGAPQPLTRPGTIQPTTRQPPMVRQPVAPIPAMRGPVEAPVPMPARRPPVPITVRGGMQMQPPVPMPPIVRAPTPMPPINRDPHISDASQRNREQSRDGSVTGTSLWNWIMNG